MDNTSGQQNSSGEIWVCHLGLVPYLDGVAIQERLRAARQADELPDTLLLLEHPPVYTRGRRAEARELPFEESFYRAKGIQVHATDRGGRITYHGPGQLVGYAIMAVDDIGGFVRTMESAIVAAMSQTGIDAHARTQDGPDYTGVWVSRPSRAPASRSSRERKIASIGVHVARGVSTHGFAVNVDNDLEPFSWVVACGLSEVAMTSVAQEAGAGCWPISDRSPACFRRRMTHAFCQAHGRRQRLVSPTRLGIDTANADRRAQRAPMKTISSAVAEPAPA